MKFNYLGNVVTDDKECHTEDIRHCGHMNKHYMET